jgi:hypothetical protein
MDIIEDPKYAGKIGYWNQIVGTRGFKGKKTVNANTMFNQHFDVVEVDTDPEDLLNSEALQQLEQDQV